MKLVSDLYNKAASFRKDENGAILPMAAVFMTTLAIAAGAAIDYSRYANARTVMNSALDAAVLDAGIRLGSGQPVDQQFEDDFNAFFELNIAGRGGATSDYSVVSFTADGDTGAVNATATVNLETTLMRVAGIDELNAVTTSGGIFRQVDTEVTIMLDTTGSMRDPVSSSGVRKIDALKSAARNAVNTLLRGDNSRTTRVGLVPYSASVNAGRRYAPLATIGNRDVATANGSFSINNTETRGCVTERSGPTATTGASPRTAPVGSDRRAINENNTLRGNCPSNVIRPLTNRRDELLADINNLGTSGSTAGHLGIAWSYYMLEEQWIDLWDTQDEPAPYSSDVNKIAILMTDGEFNTAYTGSGNDITSNQIAIDLCTDMKAAKGGNAGITVYSIAFDAPPEAEATLRACASEDTAGQTFFFSASSEQELNDAFNEIVDNITSLRITQ